MMNRLMRYFSDAQVCTPESRKVGIEVESLLVDRNTDQSVSKDLSQKVMRKMVEDYKWQVKDSQKGLITWISLNGFSIVYELGWNNLELITPAYSCNDIRGLLVDSQLAMWELETVCISLDIAVLKKSFDGEQCVNTLIIPDERDRVWEELDGEALYGLGHIACIHINIDLTGLDEAFVFMCRLRGKYQDGKWPAPDNQIIWRNYIGRSLAGYEADRYGAPPENFEDYCRRLSEYRVYMKRHGGSLSRVDKPRAFAETKISDMDLFLRSVWWYTRLRVRGGNLVLEIRDIPRSLSLSDAISVVVNDLLL